MFCCQGGLIYPSARKYCAEIEDDSCSDEALESEEMVRVERIEAIIKQELEAPFALDKDYVEETECKMVNQGRHHERRFQKKLLSFAERLISGVFLIFDLVSTPFQEDEEAVSLQRSLYSHLRHTRLRLGIKPVEDKGSSSSESNRRDEETDEESNEDAGGKSNDDNQDGQERQCDAFMNGGKKCNQQPLCAICVEKGKLLSIALVDALSKPPNERHGSSSKCGLQESLSDLNKEK